MSRKGKERYFSEVNGLIKKIKIRKGLSEEKVRIMADLLFDGSVYESKYHYSVMYVNSSKELVSQFINDMKKVYSVKPSTIEKAKIYTRVKYYSKQIYDDLMRYFKSYSTSDNKCSILAEILKNENFSLIILRAFWENEGSISKEGKLSADSKSYKVIKQLSKLHNKFWLKHNISKYWENGWAYKLSLYKTKKNYKRFIDLQLFSKSRVTKGYFKGKKKIDVLKEYYNRKFK